MTDAHRHLVQLASTVLQPGFEGTTAARVGAALARPRASAASRCSPATSAHPRRSAALTAALRAENPDVIVAIDEEAGDVTRFESRRGSSRPGNLALGAVDDPALTEEVARDLGHELAAAGHHARTTRRTPTSTPTPTTR